jgi:superfamily II DNA helicase RecQ
MIHVYLIIYYSFFRGGEFRQEYGQLAHLRSIVPDNTTFVALTATATKSMKTEICKKKKTTTKKLDILECESTTVWLSPERTNIAYFLSKSKKSV